MKPSEAAPVKGRAREARFLGRSEQREAWLRAHPWLYRVSTLQLALEDAARGLPALQADPDWGAYSADHLRGVPLLHSEAARFEPSAEVAAQLGVLAEQATLAAPAGPLRDGSRALREELRAPRPEHAALVRWTIDGAGPEGAPQNPGLVRWLAWTALAAALRPAVETLVQRMPTDSWNRPHCPVCGAQPMMAQLVDHAAGRRRLLSCGCCHARWGWQRLGCPHCGNEDEAKLSILEPAGSEVRLDVCSACDGYLKTYTGEGQEELLLADWTTLHLDAVAKERGLFRRGASIFEV